MATSLSTTTATSAAQAPPTLSFPPQTFAKLSPHPYLLAHLRPSTSSQPSVRPNGRSPSDFRTPTAHTSSLSHASGSAVVRVGDTACVCGVRGEVLPVGHIPEWSADSATTVAVGGDLDPADDDGDDENEGEGEDITGESSKKYDADDDEDLLGSLALLVPNIELSTGCSPSHLPGSAPTALAQTLSARLLSLLRSTHLIRPSSLRIAYQPPSNTTDPASSAPKKVTKGFWTLYIDVLVISADGNLFDAIWASVLLALHDTLLPAATYDADREMIICSPSPDLALRLPLTGLPVASTFAVFESGDRYRGGRGGLGNGNGLTAAGKTKGEKNAWILADPDAFEEGLCKESVTVVVDCSGSSSTAESKILRIEKSGGGVVGPEEMRQAVKMAEGRWAQWKGVLANVGSSR
ncbi:MAG: hypothetical protein M1819_004205 [Sarea resinae]|nr:MAG: hypothetical protein M1819_004205 [Sarea resinae]